MKMEEWLMSYAESFPEYSEIHINLTQAAWQLRVLNDALELAEESIALKYGASIACPRCKSVTVLDEHIGLCDHCIELDVDCLIDW